MHGEESLLSVFFRFVNFAILLAILIRFAGRPLKRYLSERHQRIKDEIESKNRIILETESLKNEIHEKISRLDAEIEDIKRKVLEEAYKEKERIISEARELADKLKEQVALTKEQEIKEMRAMIREEVAKKAIAEAERIIRQALKKEDHNRLVNEFIERIRGLS